MGGGPVVAAATGTGHLCLLDEIPSSLLSADWLHLFDYTVGIDFIGFSFDLVEGDTFFTS